jgi:hypothetical protein
MQPKVEKSLTKLADSLIPIKDLIKLIYYPNPSFKKISP